MNKDINIQDDKNIELPINKDKTIDINLNVNEFDINECYYNSLEDLSEKSILALERNIIRSSFEYKNYINYLKQELDLTSCPLMPGIDIKTDPVSLEFHHYPINLYDITLTVASALIAMSENSNISGFEIAEQVMKEHYENNIGLIPLTTTLHEMAHTNSILIPLECVNGNYLNFYNKYKEFMPLEVIERIEDNLSKSSATNIKQLNDEKLEKKILFLNAQYNKNPDETDFDFFDDEDKEE